jgi:hypothetical protein
MIKWLAAMAIALASVMAGITSTMADADGLSEFVETYQCSLSGLIGKILDRDKRQEHGRFIILGVRDSGADYVQCHFGERDREALCEASSGWWNKHGPQPQFTSIQLDALPKLGFSTDGSHGNFQDHLHFSSDGPEPDEVARLMLKAVYQGYGARNGMPIEVTAPFALRHGFLPRQRCMAIS